MKLKVPESDYLDPKCARALQKEMKEKSDDKVQARGARPKDDVQRVRGGTRGAGDRAAVEANAGEGQGAQLPAQPSALPEEEDRVAYHEQAKKSLQEIGNRRYEAAYLSAGERALILRMCKHFVSDQQKMISAAYAKYKKKDPAIFADHKRHHELQIAACDALFDRFRSNGWREQPGSKK